jgi:hypothetical protein
MDSITNVVAQSASGVFSVRLPERTHGRVGCRYIQIESLEFGRDPTQSDGNRRNLYNPKGGHQRYNYSGDLFDAFA